MDEKSKADRLSDSTVVDDEPSIQPGGPKSDEKPPIKTIEELLKNRNLEKGINSTKFPEFSITNPTGSDAALTIWKSIFNGVGYALQSESEREAAKLVIKGASLQSVKLLRAPQSEKHEFYQIPTRIYANMQL